MIARRFLTSCLKPQFPLAVSKLKSSSSTFLPVSIYRFDFHLNSSYSSLPSSLPSPFPSPFQLSSRRNMSHSSTSNSNSTSTSTSTSASRTYSEAIASLNTLQSNAAIIEQIRISGGKLNELAMPEFIEYLSILGYKPEDLNKLNVIHITGTKGKGSTAAFCDGLLNQIKSKDEKIGLYTSPHLVAVRERIRINSQPISEESFSKYFWQVWDKLGSNPSSRKNPKTTPLRPVYFRFLTLLAFHIFIQEGVISTILEVGIGGLYDSTNVVPNPIVTGVSALGLDHTALLGNSIQEIAVQKGGIYKKDVPALSVVQRENGREVLRKVAEKNGAPFYPIPIPETSTPITLGLSGPHQLSNASLAIHLIRIFLNSEKGKEIFPKAFESFGTCISILNPSETIKDDQSIKSELNLTEIEKKGLENSRWPGRCQTVKSISTSSSSSSNDSTSSDSSTFYLDGAHTTDSLALCSKWFVDASSSSSDNSTPLRALIFNCTNGRKSEELLSAMLDSIEISLGVENKSGNYKFANQYFDEIRFCTNTTFKDGVSAGDLTSVAASTDSSTQTLAVQLELKSAFEKLTTSNSNSKITNVQVESSIQDALESINSSSSSNDHKKQVHVLVAGSLHLVGGVMAHLKQWGWLDESLKSIRE